MMKLDRITIPTFRKLFAINMVASSSFGLFNKSRIRFDFDELSCFNFSVSWGDKEKNADSAPETSAENTSKTRTMKLNTKMFTSGFTINQLKKKDGGSIIFI